MAKASIPTNCASLVNNNRHQGECQMAPGLWDLGLTSLLCRSPLWLRETLAFPLCVSLSLYKNHKVTFLSFCYLLGKTVAQVWGRIQYDPHLSCRKEFSGLPPQQSLSPDPEEPGLWSWRAHATPDITLSKSSRVSSVSGSWENMQSSPLMQFPVVWYNLQGKSRSWLIKANASSQNPPQSTSNLLCFGSEVTHSGLCSGRQVPFSTLLYFRASSGLQSWPWNFDFDRKGNGKGCMRAFLGEHVDSSNNGSKGQKKEAAQWDTQKEQHRATRIDETAKDIMHVGAVLSPSTEPCDVKLAQLSLLWQFDVMAKIAVVSLE